MKATTKENCTIANIVGRTLKVAFRNEEFSLDKWGDVDNFYDIGNNAFLLLECEKGQKHPNTNVLKVYPFLEEHKDVSIVLLHYFFLENKAPNNRKMLCTFIANKMELAFKDRFQYISLPSDVNLIEGALKLNRGLIQKLLLGESRVKKNK